MNDRMVLIWIFHDARARFIRLDRPLYGLTAAAIIDFVQSGPDHGISACGSYGIMIGGGQGERTIARIVPIELLSPRRTAELDAGAPMISSGSTRI